MLKPRSLVTSLITLVVLAGSALTGSYLVQSEDVGQRISGLEARVTVLEQEVEALKAGDTATASAATMYTLEGFLELRQDFDDPVRVRDTAGYCSGTGGYDDIRTGANVVVLDGSGRTLATTSLELADDFDSSLTGGNSCEFEFTVEIPEADFYTLEVGHRGAPTYSFSEMEENGWRVELSIGS